MNAKNTAYEIGLFLFQLNNSANESGFNTKETWEIKITDEEEMKTIVKNFKPAVASQIPTKIMVEVYNAVKTKLNQPEDLEIAKLDDKSIAKLGLNYIVAYNLNRPIR
ncbi:MAG TPA: hypothetical protein VL088_15090 [Pedobacter sp.]|nr:hypothetical protein [Pedobacter sp.]